MIVSVRSLGISFSAAAKTSSKLVLHERSGVLITMSCTCSPILSNIPDNSAGVECSLAFMHGDAKLMRRKTKGVTTPHIYLHTLHEIGYQLHVCWKLGKLTAE